MELASALVVAVLAVAGARRLFLLGASTAGAPEPGPTTAPTPAPPHVAVIVPARNERGSLNRTLDCLDALEYPPGRIHIVAVNDGSDDATGAELERWAAGRSNATALHLPTPAGRAGALNAGIAAAPESEFIAVCDADLRPHRSWLRELVREFEDPRVGAVAGYLRPANAGENAVTRYAALESWTHQLVTSAGKDRLDLNPPALGACAYRRAAVQGMGGFRPGPSPGDDVEATAALTRLGWRTRFAETAVADNTVVESLADYWHQHVRWGRNVMSAGGASASPATARRGKPSLRCRAEALLARSGYADRLALAAAVALAATGPIAAWVPAAYMAIVGAESGAAVLRGGQRGRLGAFLLAGVIMFGVDLAASAVAVAAQLTRRPRRWRATWRLERAPGGT